MLVIRRKIKISADLQYKDELLEATNKKFFHWIDFDTYTFDVVIHALIYEDKLLELKKILSDLPFEVILDLF